MRRECQEVKDILARFTDDAERNDNAGQNQEWLTTSRAKGVKSFSGFVDALDSRHSNKTLRHFSLLRLCFPSYLFLHNCLPLAFFFLVNSGRFLLGPTFGIIEYQSSVPLMKTQSV